MPGSVVATGSIITGLNKRVRAVVEQARWEGKPLPNYRASKRRNKDDIYGKQCSRRRSVD